ncbi:Transcription initiation factor TFIID subunit 1 [Rhynchospora pubera]|uniref:Transcription initiation factor TFIID subunit 1 n=1 Tax=Rhynchospora pubera TaxID=906938 RepID=A0AAV8FD69_9POAL|nr:Transcription initiation factor TFIID subunit 1 [Rhynchospora pubera]
MADTLQQASSLIDDDDDDEEFDEPNGGNSLLGFMFGNVDNSGDLDADYLDKDAKEHLFALADKLGPSLTEIELTKASPATTTDTSKEDYDEKAEDAVDYEDIEEQYDGPEVETVTEEDNLLPKKEYFTTNIYASSLNKNASVFDDVDYDEEEEEVPGRKENGLEMEAEKENVEQPESSHPQDERMQQIETCHPEMASLMTTKDLEDLESHDVQDMEIGNEEGKADARSVPPLPVLYVENGADILRFSEIFGVKEPLKKSTQQHPTDRGTMLPDRSRAPVNISGMVEDDEEIFFRSSIKEFPNKYHPRLTQTDAEDDLQEELCECGPHLAHTCIMAQPMKEYISLSTIPSQFSNFQCPDIYPLDHEDWENQIIWGNSPQTSSQIHNREEIELEEGDNGICSVGSQEVLKVNMQSEAPALQEKNLVDNDIGTRFRRLSVLNKELLNGTWLDSIIWDVDEASKKPKPKLIFDLQDDHMIFEALDERDSDNFSQLRSRAIAMVVPKQPNLTCAGDNLEMPDGQGVVRGEEFDISNDKFYANRKGTTQTKSLAKKRANGGLRVVHSIPAIKLQTMKPRLSNKEIANFHRPRALWYPHVNQIAAQFQKDAINRGPMKVILMTLSGKGIKLQVYAEESLSSLKAKASRKLDFKPEDQKLKLYYNGRELEEDKSLAALGIRPNSVLHIVNTTVHVWPKAEKLPCEERPSRAANVFKKKSDLSVKDGHVFLMEYCEERPLILGNVGMGARLCTYYQKKEPNDPTMASLGSTARNTGMGTLLALEPSDKSPFLGDIPPGQTQSCLETTLYRAPVFPHKLASTDYLLVRSAKGSLSLRRVNRLYVVGQQEPHMEVPLPKTLQNYLIDRMLVYIYREFRAREKPDSNPSIRFDELCSHFPGLTTSIIKNRVKDCAELVRKSYNWYLVRRPKYRVRPEEELRQLVTPEKVCCMESLQAGLYHLRRMGIQKLTNSAGLSSAMNRLPGEAIELAAAAHIERELQITPWALTSNFVASTKEDKENLERLEIVGVGDPSGRGLGFSYVKAAPKAPVSNSNLKKKIITAKNTTVTGTDADLRRLSMEAAREILLKFNISDEQIANQTRWHRIALIRKISSEQATSGMQVDAAALSKFARGDRGQRMTYSQVQQQTKERCQEIWDRQAQSLSAISEENTDDEGATSDLDSFAGDLENLLDFEEGEEAGDGRNSEREEGGVRGSGLKMRRSTTQLQTEQEIEDDKVEASVILRMLQDDGMDTKGKKKRLTILEVRCSQLETESGEHLAATPGPGSSVFSRETVLKEPEAEGANSSKLLHKKGLFASEDTPIVPVKKKYAIGKDGAKIYKEKTPRGESIVCGACGQVGHMRTNKNCPKYGEDKEDQLEGLEEPSAKSNPADVAGPSQPKISAKKLIPKLSSKPSVTAESSEGVERVKQLPVKFKLGPPEKSLERNLSITVVSDNRTLADPSSEISRPVGKINKLIISNKPKPLEDLQSPRPSIVIRPPAPAEVTDSGLRKKIIIKQPRDQYQTTSTSGPHEVRKMKRIAELAAPGTNTEETADYYSDGSGLGWSQDPVSEEEQYREEQWRLYEARRYEEAKRKEEMERRKLKKKKKKKHDFTGDDYLKEHRAFRNESRRGLAPSERDRAAKRRAVVDLVEQGSSAKRRRGGGEVELSNILERIVDSLRAQKAISYLFVKPVTKKEAPDYYDIVQRPMDLSTIREKVRNLEYKSHEEFRHDVWQITYNAHQYNDGRNPDIPPLADQLLELCDHLLEQYSYELEEAEAGIEFLDY